MVLLYRKKIVLFFFLLIILLSIIAIWNKFYTQALFKPLITKALFPEYDYSYLKESEFEKYSDSEYFKNDSFILVCYTLDETTSVSMYTYKSVNECKQGLKIDLNGEKGDFLVNTEDFDVFVTKKFFSILNLETEQTIFIRNGSTLYYISKYSFFFTQNDFKDSIQDNQQRQSN